MSKLELILLGRFECLLSTGSRVSLPMRKAEMLLAFLALAPGLRHPRERLINLLWSDRGEQQARNSLRQCLSAIRKSLGEAADMVLQIDRTSVCLNPELIEVDVHEFERLVGGGDYESLLTAADLYQGEFLEGISIRDAASQEWLEGERARFKRQFVEILHNLAETQFVSHDYAHALRSAGRLVKQDPLDEAGWRLLMQSHAVLGNRNRALEAFKRCQQTLQQELGVDPEAATVELRERIAAGDAGQPTALPATHTATGTDRRDAPADGHGIAVLPFVNLSGDPEQEYFSDGITSSLILGLGMFRGLRVKSQNSSFAFRGSDKSSADIAAALGVDFLVEGSIRKSGSKIRLAVQLVESASDTQIWGKQYDAELEDILELEQRLSSAIAGTLSGRIGHTLQKSASHKSAKNLRSYDYLQRGLYHFGKFTARDLATAREMIEKCLEIDPENATAHTNLGIIHVVELMENWSANRRHCEECAHRHLGLALEFDPENALAHAYMSEYMMIIRRDFEQGEFHADKAIECNPTASEGYVAKADLLALARRVDEALPYADKGLQLDPHSVGAGWAAGGVYREAGDYQKSIKTLRSINHPPASVRALIAVCLLKLELTEEAHQEMAVYRQLARQEMPSYPARQDQWRGFWRTNIPYRYDEDFDRFFDLLLEAGLLDEAEDAREDVPSIAVLPFYNMSGDPEQEHFADGITTDIVSILSKFRHLRTVSRYSTLQYKQDKAPITDIAAQQGVRYLLEGSVRTNGPRIRVSAELIDSVDGQILWSERYDRDLDDLFAVQDEITRNIAIAMKVRFDDGEMASYRSAGTRSIRAWELTLIATELQDTYVRRYIQESRARVREALALDPGYAFAWVILGWTYFQEAFSGLSEFIEPAIAEAEQANRQALDLDPDLAEGWSQSALLQMMKREPEAALQHCRKAVELEPGNAEVQVLMAFVYLYVGDLQQSRKHNAIMLELCPVPPNWYYLPGALIEQLTGNLEHAIETLRRAVDAEPDSPLCRYHLIHALVENGERTEAGKVADEIRGLDAAANGRGVVHAISHDAALRERFRASLEEFDLY